MLYSYLSMPFIAIFGLNEFSVRLLAAVLGSLALLVFYSLARRIRGEGFGLLALFLLATNPWHIQISRWALESNILPFFLLLGIWLLVLAREHDSIRYLVLSAASFALALYAYGAAFIFLPIFFIISCIYLIKKCEMGFKTFLPAILVFSVIAMPIVFCNLFNTLGIGEVKVLGITLPELTESRAVATTVFSKGGNVEKAFENFGNFIKLLWTQNDGQPWSSNNHFGVMYGVPGLIVFVFGLFGFLRRLRKKAISSSEFFLFFALLAAFASAVFIDVKIVRINMVWIPIIYFQALGLYFVIKAIGDNALYPVVATISILCFLFTLDYFSRQQKVLSSHFFGGLGAAIEYAEQLDSDFIQITDVNMPYIYVLFYNKIPPQNFIDDVIYNNPTAAFKQVISFSKYCFWNDPPFDRTAMIARNAYPGGIVMGRYDNYTVTLIP